MDPFQARRRLLGCGWLVDRGLDGWLVDTGLGDGLGGGVVVRIGGNRGRAAALRTAITIAVAAKRREPERPRRGGPAPASRGPL